MNSKILIVGNFSCANRGDLAILRGLLNLLKDNKNEFDIITQDLESAKQFLGSDYNFISEKLFFPNNSRIKRNLFRTLILFGLFPFLKSIKTKIKYDNIYFVGGSYFIDAYGLGKFDLLGKLILESKSVKLVGHSVGPFNTWKFRRISKLLFKECSFIGIRDVVSLEYVHSKLELNSNVQLIPDTAFVFKSEKVSNKKNKKTTIGITVRELSPFDKILNISQDDYNRIFLNLANFLLLKEYNIVVASMCTSINGYHKDDRGIAKKIFKQINDEKFDIIEDELSDLELGEIFEQCDVVIGTRLHSCILSMTVGTPAIAVYYEHKSKGVFQKLEMEKYSIEINDLKNHQMIYKLILEAMEKTFIYNLKNKISKEQINLKSLNL